MKKAISILLALAMLFTLVLTAAAETTDTADAKQAEAEAVMEWLSTQIPEEEAQQMLTWDRETILSKLEGYDQPLEYNTKEELADELLQTLSLFNLFAGMAESGDGGEALMGLFGTLMSGADSEENGEDLGIESLLGLFGSLAADEDGFIAWDIDDAENQDWEYEIIDLFNGTFWENGEMQLQAVFQDGYYKVAITEGDTELSYLCEYNELEENDTFYMRLISVGTGSEDLDAEQADHGVATFVMNDEGDLVWQKADGTEIAFTQMIDPLETKSWYADGKTLTIDWLGGLNYTLRIDGGVDGAYWTYQCALDEETDTLTGTGNKTMYGEEEYADANAAFVFGDARILLTWTDDQAAEAANGLTFEMIEDAFTMTPWQNEAVDDLMGYFIDGSYIMTIVKDGTPYSYVCSFDREQSKLTAVDPSTLDPEEYSEPENFRSTGSFELLDDDHMLWRDDSGAAGEDGIVLERVE